MAAQEHGKPYGKLQAYFMYRKKYSRKGSIRTTIFANYALGDLPTHERFYLSTDVDPELNNKFILSRNSDWYTPGHTLLYANQYTIPGYLYADDTGLTPSTTGLMGAKVSVNIPKIESVSLLAGLGLILDQSDEKMEAIGSLSPIWSLGPLQFTYTPLILDTGSIDTDWKRFQIALDLSTTSIRIGI